jgi:hypothetical protein
MVKFKLVFVLFSLSIFVGACNLFKKDIYKDHPCINNKTQNLNIEWGYYLNQTKDFYGFRLNTKGEIYSITKSKQQGEYLLTISKEDYCNLYSDLNTEVFKSQTLNVPRDTNCYFIIENKQVNYFFRALWDPNFKNVGSDGFKEVWRKFNQKLPIDENGKKMYYNFEFND